MFSTKTSLDLGVLHSDKSNIDVWNHIVDAHEYIWNHFGILGWAEQMALSFSKVVLKWNIHIVGERYEKIKMFY